MAGTVAKTHSEDCRQRIMDEMKKDEELSRRAHLAEGRRALIETTAPRLKRERGEASTTVAAAASSAAAPAAAAVSSAAAHDEHMPQRTRARSE